MKSNYEAVIIGIMFDEHDEFEDVIFHGISRSPEKTFSIIGDEIMRLYEDFGDSETKEPVQYHEQFNEIGEQILVIDYKEGAEHIYMFFDGECKNGTETN